jgi:Arc/MetJ-type ribon-helix-helix transcriptional regulator
LIGKEPAGLVPIRLPKDLQQAIERVAVKHKRSRSAEIRDALRYWVGRERHPERHVRLLTVLIALLIGRIERATGRRWNNDPLTAQAVREQVERLIGHFAPASAEPLIVPAEISKIVSELIVTLEFLATPGVPALEAFGDQEEFERLIADVGSGWSRNKAVWLRREKP